MQWVAILEIQIPASALSLTLGKFGTQYNQ